MKNFPLLVCMEKSWLIHNHSVTGHHGPIAYLDAVRVLFPAAYGAMETLVESRTFSPNEIRSLLIALPHHSDYDDEGYSRKEQAGFDSARKKLHKMRDEG